MSDFDRKDNKAIRHEIAERLRVLLSSDAADIPPRLRELINRLLDEASSKP